VALDQGVWGYTYVYGLTGQRVQPIDRLVASADAPHDARPGELLFEPLQQGSDMRNLSNLSLLRGLRRASGYVALVPARVLDPADSVTQRIAGVAWRLDGAVWSRVTGGMPRARLVSEARWSADIRADLHALDVSRVALVDTAVPPLSGEPGSTRLVSDRPGAIVVETTATGRQLLVVTERFHEGWAATEDGTPRPVIRVFGDYLGCIVDPGVHRIVLQFAPHSLRTGLIATTAGVLLTLAMTLWLRRGKNLPPIEERKHAAWVE
jgi:hypothetical protein